MGSDHRDPRSSGNRHQISRIFQQHDDQTILLGRHRFDQPSSRRTVAKSLQHQDRLPYPSCSGEYPLDLLSARFRIDREGLHTIGQLFYQEIQLQPLKRILNRAGGVQLRQHQ